MKTWNEYKDYVKLVDPEIGSDIDEVESVSAIVASMVKKRNAMGLSQRDLADMCGIPQSSVARIESGATIPKLSTLLKIFGQLNLKLTVTQQ